VTRVKVQLPLEDIGADHAAPQFLGRELLDALSLKFTGRFAMHDLATRPQMLG
jgi:hypothetical protein